MPYMIRPSFFQYEYVVKTSRLIDGDTLAVELDLGFALTISQSCRILHIDAPEHTTLAGQLVTQVVGKWLAAAAPISVVSVQLDKFAGRFDGVVYNHDRSDNLANYLLSNSLARPYEGDKKPPWTSIQLQAVVDKANSILSLQRTI